MSERTAPFVWATVVGVVCGVAYVASPLTMWVGAAVLGLFVWAGRGVTSAERRWIWGILSAALALRLVVIAILFLTSEPHETASFFWDGDGAYLKHRSLWIRNVWLDVPITPRYFELAFDRAYGWTTYLYVLAYLQYLLGPAPYAIHLFNVAVFMTVAIVLHRMARSAYGRPAALVGLGLVLFLPTPFLWSVAALKESLYLLLVAVGMAAMVQIVRGRGLLRRILGAAVLTGSMIAIGTVRGGGNAILGAGLAAGLVGGVVARRLSLVLLTLVLVPLAGYRVLSTPDVQAQIMAQLRTSAVLHAGNVRTEGHGYKLLDQRFYSNPTAVPVETMTPAEGARFVIRAMVSFVIVPLPWQIHSTSEMAFLAQQAVWYLLVVLAVIGVAAGVRRDALVTCVLLGVAMAGAAAISLNSGNVGTMVRHRDTVVPFVVWLSAVGAVATCSAWMSRASSRAVARAISTGG